MYTHTYIYMYLYEVQGLGSVIPKEPYTASPKKGTAPHLTSVQLSLSSLGGGGPISSMLRHWSVSGRPIWELNSLSKRKVLGLRPMATLNAKPYAPNPESHLKTRGFDVWGFKLRILVSEFQDQGWFRNQNLRLRA